MFWKDPQMVLLIKYSTFFIEVVVQDEEKKWKWRFFTVYVSTEDRVRWTQFCILRERIQSCYEACLVMGDFIDILTTMEKEWEIPWTERSLMGFRNFVADCDLMDLGFVGRPFMWRNC